MRRTRPLLWLCVGSDLLGILLGAIVAVRLRHEDLTPVMQADGLLFVATYLLLAWLQGAYSFLRWPWMPYRQLAQRFIVLVGVNLALAVVISWLLNSPAVAVWFHRSTLVILSAVMMCWGLLQRLWLQPIAQRQATRILEGSPVVRQSRLGRVSRALPAAHGNRQMLLLVVAYHPSQLEVDQLRACLELLDPSVGYAVVINDYQPGEPAEQLVEGADCHLFNRDNPGYGRAINRLVVRQGQLPPYLGVLNTDLSWEQDTFEQLIRWLEQHPGVALAVPQILDEDGRVTKLCKRNPTLLGLLSRRFVPHWLKPAWLKRYDRWYVMADYDYSQEMEAAYLSGCCMVVRSDAFRRAGGFDERYFLYLEDADLTRTLAREGRCLHLPIAQVVHGWGRGNYRDLDLLAANLVSAWHYFRKWGWVLW